MSESKAVAKALASGYIFDAKAFGVIRGLPSDFDVETLIERVLSLKSGVGAGTKVITEADVTSAMPPAVPASDEKGSVAVGEPTELEVVSDPTPAINPMEANEGFSGLFKDRYNRLLSVVRSRADAKNLVGLASAKNVPEGKKVRVAGLLSNKVNRKNVVEVTLDDPTGIVRVLCQDGLTSKSAMEAPLDGMVIAELSRSRAGQLYADSIALPDIPGKRVVATSRRVYAVLLSDLHVGSRKFLADDFQRFLLWLNGGLGDRDIVDRVKYLVIAGDLVDGVGVYPGQEFQLAEVDPKRQYEAAAQLLKQVPAGVQIVIGPGNHDAVRQALPQPAVSLDVAGPLYEMDNVRWVGDPAYVRLHGVNFLVYHGKSLDDVIATTPNLSYDKPMDAMKLLLRARHLAPTYGKRTALSPELRDFLVIDSVPDVFHSGHVHTFGELSYRGTVIVNSGTWQAQTSFQANMGLQPTPSIIPILDLSTLTVLRRNFGAAGFSGA